MSHDVTCDTLLRALEIPRRQQHPIGRFMTRHFFSPLLILCATTLPWGALRAAELVVAIATDRPPYAYKADKLITGIEIDLVTAIMGAAGHQLKVVELPKIRMLKELQEKTIDIATTVTPNKDEGIFFSEPYLEFQNMAISKASNGIQLKEIAELKQFSFVIWQTGWKSLGPQFEADYRPDAKGIFPKNYFQAPHQLSQNKMFWANRVQIIIIDKTIFEHHKKILSAEYDTAIPLLYHDIFGGKTSYAVAFNQANLRDQFNAGLKKIRLNGDYQRIINAYL